MLALLDDLRGVRSVIWWLIAAGLALRIGLAFAFEGGATDIENLGITADRARENLWSLYDESPYGILPVWPYPAGLVPWVVAADWIADATGLAFHGVVQLAPIAADAIIVLLVYAALGGGAISERGRTAAAALVALGPGLFAISGYHGQLDSVAVAPALAGLLVWERLAPPQRAIWAGLLIGCGAAVKHPVILVVFALLPSARSVRELVLLPLLAGLLPAALLAPFLVHEAGDVIDALTYPGTPGLAGLGLVVHAAHAVTSARFELDSPLNVGDPLYDSGTILVATAIAVALPLMVWKRTGPRDAAVLVWLIVYVFGVNLAPQYVVWGIPFFLAAGHLKAAAALQAALVLPFVVNYFELEGEGAVRAYVTSMVVLWAAAVIALAINGRRALLR